MELHIFFLQLLAFLMSVTILIMKFLKRTNSSSSSLNLPPGPPRLPLIGNIHQLLGCVPHHKLRDLANKYGPLMHLQLGEVSAVIVSSAEFAREVMNTHDIAFASRPELLIARFMGYNSTDIAFAPYGEYWRQLRKICVLELMSMKRVRSFRHVRAEERENILGWIASRAGTSINLSQMLNSTAYATTARIALGEKCEEQDRYISVVKEMLETATGFSMADLYPSAKSVSVLSGMAFKLKRLHQEADNILGNIIDKHRTSKDLAKNEDLVDVLLKFEGLQDSEFSLTTDNVKAIIQDVFAGGSETTATTVSWAISEMIRNPRVMEKAQAEVREVFSKVGGVDETAFTELSYLKLVTKETLRLHPPLPLLIPRECRQKCKIGGFDIPEKTRVMINAWAIAREPEYWSDAERFHPERFRDGGVDFKGTDFEYIPFGAGRRICPGMAFGVANVENLLAPLLYHFDWKLPHGMKPEDLDMSETIAVSAQRKCDLYLIPIPYLSP